jgi:putative ATP-dependent endonuclease of the OLD family
MAAAADNTIGHKSSRRASVRISRLRLQDFRGWSHLDLRPGAHVLLAGVPRAGRSDVVAALGRLLDPFATRLQPVLTDIRQWRQVPATTANGNGQ